LIKKTGKSSKKAKKKPLKNETMGLLRSIFGLLDSDEDGKISAEKCEISQIHPLVLEIIRKAS